MPTQIAMAISESEQTSVSISVTEVHTAQDVSNSETQQPVPQLHQPHLKRISLLKSNFKRSQSKKIYSPILGGLVYDFSCSH